MCFFPSFAHIGNTRGSFTLSEGVGGCFAGVFWDDHDMMCFDLCSYLEVCQEYYWSFLPGPSLPTLCFANRGIARISCVATNENFCTDSGWRPRCIIPLICHYVCLSMRLHAHNINQCFNCNTSCDPWRSHPPQAWIISRSMPIELTIFDQIRWSESQHSSLSPKLQVIYGDHSQVVLLGLDIVIRG